MHYVTSTWHMWKTLIFAPSHLREHEFKHSFQNTLNQFCSCGPGVETNMHFFLFYPLFNQRCTLLSKINNIDISSTILMIRYWLLFFILAKCLYIYLYIPSYLMQLWIIPYQRTYLKNFFLVFCISLPHVHLFSYPNVFSETIHLYFI